MIVDYYLGKGQDSVGNTIQDYLSYNEDNFIEEREWVPWVFPLPDNNNGWPNAPKLSQEDVSKFREDTILREMVRSTVNHYLRYLNNTTGWRATVSPDHIRVTRMIRFLSVINMTEEAKKVSQWCCERGGSKRVKQTWEDSRNFKLPWENQEGSSE